MPRRLPAEADNHLISFGSAGFSAVRSNKQAWLHTYKSGLSIQYLVMYFWVFLYLHHHPLPESMFQPALVDFTRVAGFSTLIIFYKR